MVRPEGIEPPTLASGGVTQGRRLRVSGGRWVPWRDPARGARCRLVPWHLCCLRGVREPPRELPCRSAPGWQRRLSPCQAAVYPITKREEEGM